MLIIDVFGEPITSVNIIDSMPKYFIRFRYLFNIINHYFNILSMILKMLLMRQFNVDVQIKNFLFLDVLFNEKETVSLNFYMGLRTFSSYFFILTDLKTQLH